MKAKQDPLSPLRPQQMLRPLSALLGAALCLLLAATGSAAEDTLEISTVNVIGSSEAVSELPGSGDYVSEEEIRAFNQDNVNQVLRRVPGVYVREEDGMGVFPSISLRGVDTTRSAKVTLMEDGVLTQPAPYSAPEAYYAPTVGRMSGLEILKGSSQVKHGPHTTGGVINYLSTPVPLDSAGYGRITYGSDNEIRTHLYVGDTKEYSLGRFGWLLEGYFRDNDGFKHIDETPDFQDGGETGMTRAEPMLKLAWEPTSSTYQLIEGKVGYTDMEVNEGYLGLSEEDFDDDPFRRYSASRFDQMRQHHFRSYLRHLILPTKDLDLTTTAYYNKFHRNWFKLNDLLDVPDADSPGQTTKMSLSSALAGANGGNGLDLLRGEGPGTLRYRNNNRDYELAGLDSQGNLQHKLAGRDAKLSFGARYHWDMVRRDQQDESFEQAANGTITSSSLGEPGGAGDRREETYALALWMQDSIKLGRFTLIPGLRYEHLDQSLRDYGSPANNGDNAIDLWGGGFGLTYDASDQVVLFTGVHRGFSPPSPSAAIKDGLNEETSLASEVGARWEDTARASSVETTVFYTHFDDLIVLDNIGGTGNGNSENVGKVNSYGLELAAETDPGAARGWGFLNPWFATLTLTQAELDGDAESEDPESIFAGGKDGNDVPYIPPVAFSVGTGYEKGPLAVSLAVHYVDSVYTTASNTNEQLNPLGEPDSRYGKTDSYTTVDLSATRALTDQVTLLAGVQNLTDEEYLVSRHPHGPRPGRDRFVYAGLEMSY